MFVRSCELVDLREKTVCFYDLDLRFQLQMIKGQSEFRLYWNKGEIGVIHSRKDYKESLFSSKCLWEHISLSGQSHISLPEGYGKLNFGPISGPLYSEKESCFWFIDFSQEFQPRDQKLNALNLRLSRVCGHSSDQTYSSAQDQLVGMSKLLKRGELFV